MALTRRFLSALGIEADKIDEIIAAHTDSIEGLKEQRDKYKADADKLPEVQKELDDLKKQGNGEDWESKYNELKTEYDQYKTDIDAKETKIAKEKAYTDLLKEAGVSEKRIASILRVTNLDDVELEDGKVKDHDAVKGNIETEWSDFIVRQEEQGAKTATPPTNNSGSGRVMGQSRAAQLAAQYHDNLYGAVKEDK